MKIIFEASQQFQLDAIDSVLDIFRGQRLASQAGWMGGSLTVANRCSLTDAEFLENVREIQKRNGLPESNRLLGRNFSVEMETGTGKTYVYLRSAFELAKAYGYFKFVVVVPSVAIREGVIKSIEMLREHFRVLYPSMPLVAWAYESSKVSRLKEFSMGAGLHVLVLNIDSFNKDSTVLNKPHDRFQGQRPVEYVAACQPIVVVDEPQELESEGSRQAIAQLSPLCTLRYSATHRFPYNLVFRLDPVRAYELGLVKRIEVHSVLEDTALSLPYIQVRTIEARKRHAVALLRIDATVPGGVERRTITARPGTDLFEVSGKRHRYRGYVVGRIDAKKGFLQLTNGERIAEGATSGGRTDEVMRLQVKETVKAHLEKEIEFASLPPEKRMKVLSLFFVDRVANYAGPDGKIRKWFEDAYRVMSRSAKYKSLSLPPEAAVQAAYFATSNGASVDSTGRPTVADQEAFHLIMKNKERLLSAEEPVRFIFTHSALREGWDNPNVFQVCTLNEAFSEIRKRQEIGRGLRLPVQSNGLRSFDRRLNRLTIIANEYYGDFAEALQREIVDECGVDFGDRISDARKRTSFAPDPASLGSAGFRKLWRAIRQRTTYQVSFDDRAVADVAHARIKNLPETRQAAVTTVRTELDVGKGGVTATVRSRGRHSSSADDASLPDIVSILKASTPLTRESITQILLQTPRLGELLVNPQAFTDRLLVELREAVRESLVRGISYLPLPGKRFSIDQFEAIEAYQDRLVAVKKSVYPFIEVDSNVERSFAESLEAREDVELFIKLPRWFKIATPVGGYNPDWAVLLRDDEGAARVLICETKGSSDPERLRWQSERDKITCGRAHFSTLGIKFIQVSSADEVQA